METLKSIAAAAGLPESTVRIYRDEFEEFLEAMGEGRRRRYGPESAERLARICTWKRDGRTNSQIRDDLAREARPQARTRRRTTEDRLDELAALMRAQASEMTLLRAEVGSLRAALRDLIAAMEQDTPPQMEEIAAAFAMAERR